MSRLLDLTGQRFGRLMVIQRAENTNAGKTRWRCKCDCGNVCIKATSQLRSGKTRSCGCLRKETLSRMRTIHGLSGTRLHRIWAGMNKRCINPKSPYYYLYGGRGITVCDEWKHNFQAFYDWALANGYNEKLSIDRIDNDKGYSPANCRWATASEQRKNQRRNKHN